MNRENRSLKDARLRAVLEPVPLGFDSRPGLRLAAVLVPWLTIEGVDHVLLTRRRDDLPHHAGQIAFPGGAREGDEDPVQCALRESAEEIGLEPSRVTILGALPARPSIAGFWVHVVVGRVLAGAELRPDPREVASLRAWPLDVLRDASRWVERAPDSDPTRSPSPHLLWEGELLWGLTARVALDLIARLDAAGD